MKRRQRWFFFILIWAAAVIPSHSRAEATAEDNPFPLLPGLEQPVEFWKKIFSEYSVTQIVFFDLLEMSKIYEVIDVGIESRPKEFIDSERARIAALYEVDLERVKAQRGIKEKTAAGLKRANRYLAQMQQIFRERGLPVELTYLPLIESSYNIGARSHAGAVGMWQFMPATGRQFLRVSRAIDERRDPLESTRAAATFLKHTYDSLGSWPLAITAYNFGPTAMARAVAEVGSNNLVDIIEKYSHPHFGYPPKNFYAEFLAAVEIGRDIERYFPGLELDPPVAIQEVEMKTSASMTAVLRSTGLKREEFIEWNPALINLRTAIPAGYRVKMPLETRMAAIVEVQQAPVRQQRKMVRHRVQRGETVGHIARRYGTSAERILKINGIRRANLLRAGSTVLVPQT